MRKEIEKKLGVLAIDIYGLSESNWSGVSYECECQNGMHICEDHFYPEIIDLIREVLSKGEKGELVLLLLLRRFTINKIQEQEIFLHLIMKNVLVDEL